MLFPVIVLMNLVMYPVIIAMTTLGIVLFPLWFMMAKVTTGWDNDRVMRFLVWIYGRTWTFVMAPFVHFRKDGMEKAAIGLPCIIVVNHFSFFDTYCMGLLPLSDVTFAVRSWPFKALFFYRPFMRLAGYLDVEAIGWEGTLERCNNLFARKGAVLFFPEGHRSSDGQVKRFYTGPFKLAVETGVPVLPLCITGTDVLLPPGRWWMKPATVRLSALDPVYPEDFAGDGETAHISMRKHVRGIIMNHLKTIAKAPAMKSAS